MARPDKIFKIIINIFTREILSCFLFILNLDKQRVLWNHWHLLVLKYFTCLRACVLLWHRLSYFICVWKGNFQNSLHRKISFYSKKYLELTIFAKRLKTIDFSKISSFLFPTANKRTHKFFFWQHSLGRIFINILYYLNSHNLEKKKFFFL